MEQPRILGRMGIGSAVGREDAGPTGTADAADGAERLHEPG